MGACTGRTVAPAAGTLRALTSMCCQPPLSQGHHTGFCSPNQRGQCQRNPWRPSVGRVQPWGAAKLI